MATSSYLASIASRPITNSLGDEATLLTYSGATRETRFSRKLAAQVLTWLGIEPTYGATSSDAAIPSASTFQPCVLALHNVSSIDFTNLPSQPLWHSENASRSPGGPPMSAE